MSKWSTNLLVCLTAISIPTEFADTYMLHLSVMLQSVHAFCLTKALIL